MFCSHFHQGAVSPGGRGGGLPWAVKAPVSGHPRETEKVSVTGAGRLGTGHYLSPGGVGGFFWGGNHLIFRRTEGGISRN